MNPISGPDTQEQLSSGNPTRTSSSLFGQIGMTGVAIGFVTLFGFVNSALVARILGPEGRGIIEAIFLIPSLVPLLALFSVSSGIIYYAGVDSEQRLIYQSTGLAFGVIAALVCLVMGVLFRGYFWNMVLSDVPMSNSLLSAMISAMFLLVLSAAVEMIILSERKMGLFNLSNIVMTVAKFFLILPTIFIYQLQSVEWIAWGTVISSFLSLLILLPGLRGCVSMFAARMKVFIPLLIFSLKAHFGNVLQKGNLILDKFIVAAFLPKADLGIYGLAVLLAQFLWIIPSAVTPVLLTYVASSKSLEEDRVSYLVARVVLWASVVLGLLMALASPVFISVVFGADFSPAVLPLLILLPGEVLISYLKVVVRIITGKGKPMVNSVGASIGFVVTVILLLLLLPLFGIVGAAIASTASYLIYSLFILVYAQKVLKLPVYPDMVWLQGDQILAISLMKRTKSIATRRLFTAAK
jgi:O-antigen/teichoic acid export membrane protein